MGGVDENVPLKGKIICDKVFYNDSLISAVKYCGYAFEMV
jgi:hypothetical protein